MPSPPPAGNGPPLSSRSTSQVHSGTPAYTGSSYFDLIYPSLFLRVVLAREAPRRAAKTQILFI